MTPGEFREFAERKIKWYEQNQKSQRNDQDALNGFLCLLIQRSLGNKEAKLEDFMIFTKQDPPKQQTEAEWNSALSSWIGTGGR